MLLKVTCDTNQINNYIEYYESYGFTLLSRDFDVTTVELTFQGHSAAHSASFLPTDPSARAFLSFSDGTLSPLYVRRQHDVDD